MPKRGIVRLVMRLGDRMDLFGSVRRLGKQDNFIVTPFQVKGSAPVILLEPSRMYRVRFSSAGRYSSSVGPSCCDPMTRQTPGSIRCTPYASGCTNYFNVFVGTLHRGRFSGLMLSHSRGLSIPSGFSPTTTFRRTYEECLCSCICLYCAPRAKM